MANLAFDVNRFLTTEYEAEFSVERPKIPEGEWRAMTKEFDVQPGNNKGSLQGRLHLEFIDDELAALEEMKGRDKIVTTHMLFIDVDENFQIKYSGGLNWQLGQIRAALGQNDPRKPWSPAMLAHRGPILVKVEHRNIGGKDGKELRTVDNIVKWAAA